MRRVILFLAFAVCIMLVSCKDNIHVHEWTATEAPQGSDATILEKGPVEYLCTDCGATKTEEGYLPITGYWKTLIMNTSQTKERYYFSFDDDSDVIIDNFSRKRDDDAKWSGRSMDCSYSWLTDSSDRRVRLKVTMTGDDGKPVEIPFIPVLSEDEDLKLPILELTPEEGYTDKMPKLRLHLDNRERHFHTGEAKAVEDNSEGYLYHLLTLSCGDSFHESAEEFRQMHSYENTDEKNRELCSSCSRERTYRVIICNENSPDTPDIEYVTNRKGFKLEDKYYSSAAKATYKVKGWYFKDWSKVPADKVYHPEKDGVVIMYVPDGKPVEDYPE